MTNVEVLALKTVRNAIIRAHDRCIDLKRQMDRDQDQRGKAPRDGSGTEQATLTNARLDEAELRSMCLSQSYEKSAQLFDEPLAEIDRLIYAATADIG